MLESCEYPDKPLLGDGKRRKLDTYLGETVIECKKMAAAIKREREDRAEAERLRGKKKSAE